VKPVTRIVAVILGILSLGPLLRVLLGWEVVINDTVFPMWPSVLAFVIFAGLAVLLWREGRGERLGRSTEKPQVGPTDFL
jgi:hypothetical protein